MTEFHISKRTALRDITDLEQLGLTFYVDSGRYGGYRLTKRDLWVPVLFNIQEINALFFAIKALSLLSLTPFKKSYQVIYDKLMATLPLKEQQAVTQLQQIVTYYNVPNVDAPNFLGDLLTASLGLTQATATLTSGKTHRFQIADLLYRHGIWFFNAYDLDQSTWGTYRADTLQALTLGDPAPYTRADLVRFQQDYETHHHNIPFRCQLTPTGRELVQKNSYPNMRLEKTANQDYLTGGYNQDEFAYMVQYLLGLGSNVKILYPQALQEAYLQEMRHIMDLYN